MSTTDLTISGLGIAPYSARGLRQTLKPIAAASQVKRMASGELRSFGYAAFQKFESDIYGSDQQPPALDAVWPGRYVTVDCIATLAIPIGGSPPRSYIEAWEDGDFLIYRPRLNMAIVAFDMERDEWQAGVTWTLRLLEV